MMRIYSRAWVLPVIIFSQFLCTSLWFAGNAILPDLTSSLNADPDLLAVLTSIVQLGFISGTLVFAALSIPDRFSPSLVFFLCSIIAASCNLGMIRQGLGASGLLSLRFMTGFFLAGIYPVGMKIASDHYREGLGRSLGFLVGALAAGTALPHLLKSMGTGLPWKLVIITISLLCTLGGILMIAFVPDGPFRKPLKKAGLTAFLHSFQDKNFRSAAFGYFGHMWELYTFWAFVPVILQINQQYHHRISPDVPFFSFLVIASGGFACMFSGYLAERFGTKRTASAWLLLSGICCMLSPLFLLSSSTPILITFLILWGMAVLADSPLFSTMIAHSAPESSKGTSLTIVTCIGFAVTIVSIQVVNALSALISPRYLYLVLAAGPVIGVYSLLKIPKELPASKN